MCDNEHDMKPFGKLVRTGIVVWAGALHVDHEVNPWNISEPMSMVPECVAQGLTSTVTASTFALNFRNISESAG